MAILSSQAVFARHMCIAGKPCFSHPGQGGGNGGGWGGSCDPVRTVTLCCAGPQSAEDPCGGYTASGSCPGMSEDANGDIISVQNTCRSASHVPDAPEGGSAYRPMAEAPARFGQAKLPAYAPVLSAQGPAQSGVVMKIASFLGFSGTVAPAARKSGLKSVVCRGPGCGAAYGSRGFGVSWPLPVIPASGSGAGGAGSCPAGSVCNKEQRRCFSCPTGFSMQPCVAVGSC